MTAPTTFAAYLAMLPTDDPIRAAHAIWSTWFELANGGNAMLIDVKLENCGPLIAATTALRAALEEADALRFSVVRAYSRLLEADCGVIRARMAMEPDFFTAPDLGKQPAPS